MILDSEVLLIDNKTGKPLPFGTLGVHKKAAFQDANVCLFVFDCIYFNDVSLMDRPLCERRKFLHDNMVEIPNRIMFSEMKQVMKASDLVDMINRVIREGLEGLVLKDVKGTYEPGKRHWHFGLQLHTPGAEVLSDLCTAVSPSPSAPTSHSSPCS